MHRDNIIHAQNLFLVQTPTSLSPPTSLAGSLAYRPGDSVAPNRSTGQWGYHEDLLHYVAFCIEGFECFFFWGRRFPKVPRQIFPRLDR
jgi:hypothetical protein